MHADTGGGHRGAAPQRDAGRSRHHFNPFGKKRRIRNPRKGADTMTMSTINLTEGMRQNLFSLQQTSTMMQKTQSRLASGLKVQSSLDDPINFFAAAGHRQRAGDLSQLKDAMGEAIQTVKAANNGIEAIQDLIASAKSLAQSAKSADSSADAITLANQFNDVLDQIDALSTDSGYKGINLLNGTGESVTVEFNESASSKITLTGFIGSTASSGLSVKDAGTGGNVWVDAANTAVAGTTIELSITELDSARDKLRTESEKLASNLGVITTRQDFTTNMINTLEDGAAALTEADMNEEGANMLMLQTRQQLGTTSLSLASQAAQSVLRLF